jgi:hypothetical protein
VPLGEDRQFFDALRRVDARIRHATDVHIVVSARMVGRARGGMADTISRRLECPDAFIDDRLEPVGDAARRAQLRAQMRRAWQSGPAGWLILRPLGARLGLTTGELAGLLETRHFGAAWDEVEHRSPVLRRRRVATANLATETARAQRLRDILRAAERLSRAADPVGSALYEAAE